MLHLSSPQLPCNQLPIQLNAATWALFTPISEYTDCSQPGPRLGQSAFKRNALPRLLAAAEEEEIVAAELIVEAVVTIAAHGAVNGSHQWVWGVLVMVTSDVRTLLGSVISVPQNGNDIIRESMKPYPEHEAVRSRRAQQCSNMDITTWHLSTYCPPYQHGRVRDPERLTKFPSRSCCIAYQLSQWDQHRQPSAVDRGNSCV